jgi:fructose-specific phosphotransferase system component IIB
MATYIEKVTPLVVEAEPFDPKKPHVAVAVEPDGSGTIYQHEEQHKVRAGDMIVTYADGQVKPMSREMFDVTFRKATKADAPALPASTDPS